MNTEKREDKYLEALAALTMPEQMFTLQSQGVAITISENIRSWEAAYESIYSIYLCYCGEQSKYVELFNKKAHKLIQEVESLCVKFNGLVADTLNEIDEEKKE